MPKERCISGLRTPDSGISEPAHGNCSFVRAIATDQPRIMARTAIRILPTKGIWVLACCGRVHPISCNAVTSTSKRPSVWGKIGQWGL